MLVVRFLRAARSEDYDALGPLKVVPVARTGEGVELGRCVTSRLR
jgi:hypothetical protein